MHYLGDLDSNVASSHHCHGGRELFHLEDIIRDNAVFNPFEGRSLGGAPTSDKDMVSSELLS